MMSRVRSAIAAGIGLLLMAAAPPADAAAECMGKGRLVLKGAEAFDSATGLTWRRCSEGLHWQHGTCAGEQQFFPLEQARELSADGWRLPTIAELSSLLDSDCGQPATDRTAFPDVTATEEGDSIYWTSSATGLLNLFYTVDFINGIVDGHSPGLSYAVRLVRWGRR